MLPSRRHRQLLAVTYYNAVIVTGNHLRSVIDRHFACKRLQVSCARLLNQMAIFGDFFASHICSEQRAARFRPTI